MYIFLLCLFEYHATLIKMCQQVEQQVMLCYPHLYWVDRRELTSCRHYPDLGTPASYLLQWACDELSLTFYMELSRDYKWSPPSAEHHLTFDAASQTVSVSPTHMISAPLWHVRNGGLFACIQVDAQISS